MTKSKAAPTRGASPTRKQAASKKKTAKKQAASSPRTQAAPKKKAAKKQAASSPRTQAAPKKKAAKKQAASSPRTQAAPKKKAAKKKAAKKQSAPSPRTQAAPKKKATKTKATKTKATVGSKSKAAPAATGFAGFPVDLFQFLAELALSNEREWFEPRKQRYEDSVRGPALAFIRAMGTRLPEISTHFVAIDKKVGGSLMRVHRDVRFSSDKSPYKTNVGIQFRHATGKDVHAPGLYLHLEPGQCFLAVGLWHPEPEALSKIRARILDRPDAWQRIRDDPTFRGVFELQGEALKRPPRGIDPEHPHVEDLKRKDHIAVATMDVSLVQGPTAVDEIARRFVTARDYLRFLCEAVDVAF
ncbi:DUF2461 domain-containing protein [Paraliomyxa miuraensis]|uniref:DUF2461 domain-containing protein n=1 Tax=Paraliomyxa miuraensis TaxID=376150 RepID=UPI00224D82B2|nr:DUF2461 domain-containing protein [Paraliomyxa miuraensis]MCX4245117.1 DUF2461 domain-containing protein [Paraliomyxa miuraensis]